MKNKEHSKLFTSLKAFSLSEKEKADIKNTIHSRTIELSEIKEGTAVRNTNPSRHQYRRMVPVFIHIYSHAQGITRALMFTALLAVPVLGTASALAHKALPGDPLYPIKIHVNEKVESLLAIDKAAKANHEAELALLRLEEVERLAKEKKLNALAVAEAKEQFRTHITNFDMYVGTLSKSGRTAKASEIKYWLRENLRAREQSLETTVIETFRKKDSKGLEKNEDEIPKQLEDLKETIEAYVE